MQMRLQILRYFWSFFFYKLFLSLLTKTVLSFSFIEKNADHQFLFFFTPNRELNTTYIKDTDITNRTVHFSASQLFDRNNTIQSNLTNATVLNNLVNNKDTTNGTIRTSWMEASPNSYFHRDNSRNYIHVSHNRNTSIDSDDSMDYSPNNNHNSLLRISSTRHSNNTSPGTHQYSSSFIILPFINNLSVQSWFTSQKSFIVQTANNIYASFSKLFQPRQDVLFRNSLKTSWASPNFTSVNLTDINHPIGLLNKKDWTHIFPLRNQSSSVTSSLPTTKDVFNFVSQSTTMPPLSLPNLNSYIPLSLKYNFTNPKSIFSNNPQHQSSTQSPISLAHKQEKRVSILKDYKNKIDKPHQELSPDMSRVNCHPGVIYSVCITMCFDQTDNPNISWRTLNNNNDVVDLTNIYYNYFEGEKGPSWKQKQVSSFISCVNDCRLEYIDTPTPGCILHNGNIVPSGSVSFTDTDAIKTGKRPDNVRWPGTFPYYFNRSFHRFFGDRLLQQTGELLLIALLLSGIIIGCIHYSDNIMKCCPEIEILLERLYIIYIIQWITNKSSLILQQQQQQQDSYLSHADSLNHAVTTPLQSSLNLSQMESTSSSSLSLNSHLTNE